MNLSFSIFLLDVFNNLMNFNDIKIKRKKKRMRGEDIF